MFGFLSVNIVNIGNKEIPNSFVQRLPFLRTIGSPKIMETIINGKVKSMIKYHNNSF